MAGLMNWKGLGTELIAAKSKQYPGICLEILRKTMKKVNISSITAKTQLKQPQNRNLDVNAATPTCLMNRPSTNTVSTKALH
jgi:hypothetical protein